MAFSNDGNMVMPVSPMGGYSGGMGFGGDWLGWIIIMLLFSGFGGGWGMGMGGGLGIDFPWLLNGQNGINANTNAGFDHAATQSAISSLQNSVISGFGDVQLGIAGVNQAICQTGNGITAALTNGFANAETAANARQIANMQQAFNAQIASMQGFNGVQTQAADIKATVLQENCQDRYEAANNTRNIIENATTNTQALLNSNQKLMDKLCQLELDGYKTQLSQAQAENLALRNQISQTEQNAFIAQGLNNEVDALYNRLSNCPVPSTPVYGRQPIFTCNGGCPNNGYLY